MESNYYPDLPVNQVNDYNNQTQTSTGVGFYNSRTTFDRSFDPSSMFIIILFFLLLLIAAIYIYFAVALQRMAKKINIQDDWFAWIPVLNLVLVLRIANRPAWWIVLLFIPIIQVIVSVIVWMDVAKAMGKEEWWGILMVIPGVNLVVIGYLAFSDAFISSQDTDSVQEESIPKDAISANSDNTDFTESSGDKKQEG